MNYQVNHNWFQFELIKDLKGNPRYATFMVLNAIVHFTRYAGSCQVHVRSFSKDLGIHNRYITEAIQLLLDNDMIRMIKPYDRKSNSAAVYASDTACSKNAQKVYHWVHQPVAQGDKGKRLLNNLKGELSDSLAESSPPKEEEMSPKKQFKFPRYN